MNKIRTLLLVILLFCANLSAQTFTVSADKRYLLKEGKPFFLDGRHRLGTISPP